MTRWLLALVLAAACTGGHDAAVRDIRSGDCVTCHREAYDRTMSPVHAGQMPTTCGDCHAQTAWQPAVGGVHPEDRFPIAAGAHDLTCLSCHLVALGSATNRENTSCIGCHTGDHLQARVDPAHARVPGYSFDAAAPHFCLTCHPDGTASQHPESAFPIGGGAHRGIACADCHDATLGQDTGGMNVNCTGCHTGIHARRRADAEHREVSRYAWSDTNKQFCRSCHPRGRH